MVHKYIDPFYEIPISFNYVCLKNKHVFFPDIYHVTKRSDDMPDIKIFCLQVVFEIREFSIKQYFFLM